MSPRMPCNVGSVYPFLFERKRHRKVIAQCLLSRNGSPAQIFRLAQDRHLDGDRGKPIGMA